MMSNSWVGNGWDELAGGKVRKMKGKLETRWREESSEDGTCKLKWMMDHIL